MCRFSIGAAHALRAIHARRVGLTSPARASSMREVRDALRQYLRERPGAADTLVGIAQWWLPEVMRGIPLEILRRTLADLVASHEMHLTILPDGSELYSGEPDRSRATEN
jgi:hypothetical protein